MDDDWGRVIDGYCERTGPEFWSEPVNAATNAAFLIAALVMLRRTGGRPPLAGVLIALLAAIGVGSFLFHTFATAWAATADVAPIALFVLVYVFAANLHFWGWRAWVAGLATLAFLPYAALGAAAFGRLPFFEVSRDLLADPAPDRALRARAAPSGAGDGPRAPDRGGDPEREPRGAQRGRDLVRRGPAGDALALAPVQRRDAGLDDRGLPLPHGGRAAAFAPGLKRGGGDARGPRSPRRPRMSVDPETVRKVARLARIRVEDEALPALAADFGRILEFVEQLGEVDVEGIEPMVSVTPMRLRRREDVVTDGGRQADVLADAPDAREGFFVVPKVVE